MYSFSDFYKIPENLYEATKQRSKEDAAKIDAGGRMHELLVGYHLNGGKHMENHPGVDDSGKRISPKEAHDQLKQKLTPQEYREAHGKAKQAAETIHNHIMGHHVYERDVVKGKIKRVSWTSKHGDTEKITGCAATQKEDPSDIYVTVHHTDEDGDRHETHHGISLKAAKARQNHLPISNPGMETTGGAEKHLHTHREGLKSHPKHGPKLKQAKSVKERKQILKDDAEMNNYVRGKNTETLKKVAEHAAKHFSGMSAHQLAQHLEHHILAARETPAEKRGHYHHRATTDVLSPGHYRTRIMNPHEHYKPIIDAARRGEISVHHEGAAVHFKHKGKIVATHGFKFKSQSDPLSAIGGRTTSTFHGKTYGEKYS